MTRQVCGIAVAVASLSMILSLPNACAQSTKRKKFEKFDDLLERVRQVTVSSEWQKPQWKDPLLESGLESLIGQVNAATKATVRLPVRFKDVQPGGMTPGYLLNSLSVSPGTSIGHAQNSIILSDTNLKISFADNCVIISRGAVEISHSRGNIVLAGLYVHVSHDGDSREPSGSLLMSGSVLDVSHCHGSVCHAPRHVQIGFATDSKFINSPMLEISRQEGCETVQGAKITLAPLELANPLDGKIVISQIVSGEHERAFVVLQREGQEIVLRPGAQLEMVAGNLPEIRGWKLDLVGNDFALFSKGRQFAGFYHRTGQ